MIRWQKQKRMILNIEIPDEEGAMLDALAQEQDRSRSAQARRLLIRAIRAAANQPEEEAE
jgi:predicted transcriptional regulator